MDPHYNGFPGSGSALEMRIPEPAAMKSMKNLNELIFFLIILYKILTGKDLFQFIGIINHKTLKMQES
jgi:hypothetical protein